MQQLGVDNPGVLTYLPDQFPPNTLAVNEARPEDESSEPRRAFSVAEVRADILQMATERAGELGADMVATSSASFGDSRGWQCLLMPATELPSELADELRTASSVQRKYNQGYSWVALSTHHCRKIMWCQGRLLKEEAPLTW